MPNEGRGTSGWLYSRDHNHGLGVYGEHLGIGGKSGNTGRLIFQSGNNASKVVAGKTEVPRWQWQHVALVREGEQVKVYLNGKLEIQTAAPVVEAEPMFLGGRSDNDANWEGRLDEAALFDRALSADEIARLALQVKGGA